MTQYSIDDQHGTNICGGLEERRALSVAQQYADDLGAPVLLYSDDGEEQLVEPAPERKHRHATKAEVGRELMLSALAAAVGDDGTGDLGVIVDHAMPGDTVADLIDVVRDARADAAAERAAG